MVLLSLRDMKIETGDMPISQLGECPKEDSTMVEGVKCLRCGNAMEPLTWVQEHFTNIKNEFGVPQDGMELKTVAFVKDVRQVDDRWEETRARIEREKEANEAKYSGEEYSDEASDKRAEQHWADESRIAKAASEHKAALRDSVPKRVMLLGCRKCGYLERRIMIEKPS